MAGPWGTAGATANGTSSPSAQHLDPPAPPRAALEQGYRGPCALLVVMSERMLLLKI